MRGESTASLDPSLARFVELGARVVQDDVELEDLIFAQRKAGLPLGDHLLAKLFRILGTLLGVDGGSGVEPVAEHAEHNAAGKHQTDVQRNGGLGELHFRRSV